MLMNGWVGIILSMVENILVVNAWLPPLKEPLTVVIKP